MTAVLNPVGQPIGNVYHDLTDAERDAGLGYSDIVDPTQPELVPNRYKRNETPLTTDMTEAVQTALDVAEARGGGQVKLLPEMYLCTANLTAGLGHGQTVDVIGSGWSNGGIQFSGAAVTTGLTYSGTALEYAGTVRDLWIRCQSGAQRCVTFDNVNHPRVDRCHLQGAAGAAAMFFDTLMGVLNHTLVTGSGSATEGSVEVDGTPGSGTSTTFKWDHSRISGAHASSAVGGLIINRTVGVTVHGGAIESCGTLVRVGHKTDSANSCLAGHIQDLDLENPGNGNPYMEFGAGLSSSAWVQSWLIESLHCTGSGTTDFDHAFEISRALGMEWRMTHFTLQGTPDSCFELTDSFGVVIGPHRHLTSLATPWVRMGGTQVKAAGPREEWNSEATPRGLTVRDSTPNLTGATPSILVSSSMGGYYGRVTMTNGSATTVTSLSDGELGMEIEVSATNGNTTLTHGTASGEFFCVGAANLTLTANLVYRFRHNGTYWAQVTG